MCFIEKYFQWIVSDIRTGFGFIAISVKMKPTSYIEVYKHAQKALD